MKATLARRPAGASTPVVLESQSITIGRNEDNDVVLDSALASRYHARIVWAGKEYAVEDLGRRNGTWIDGAQITAVTPLKDGDAITFGDAVFVFAVEGARTARMPRSGSRDQRADRLTAREAEVLILIAKGRTTSEISGDLVLSVRTVARHISNIYVKIGARGRADATSYALRNNLT